MAVRPVNATVTGDATATAQMIVFWEQDAIHLQVPITRPPTSGSRVEFTPGIV